MVLYCRSETASPESMVAERLHGGELLEFDSGVHGMALNLEEDNVGVVIFAHREIKEGDIVKPTGEVVEVPVGETLIGRVVDAPGQPIDGKGPIVTREKRPIEYGAPGVLMRKSVNEPLQTGIKAIDAMMPIGKGRESSLSATVRLAKTAIAIDTILNQKGKDVVFTLRSDRKKNPPSAQLVQTLEEREAMKYTIVVSATASDGVAAIHRAPYAGCAMAENTLCIQGEGTYLSFTMICSSTR